ncbi:MAG: hypothetical protein IT290_11045 [Deltaproteobacteria bacterium]|nr:hypothetical protein [Deltaproteobacteria bacterium]
MKNLMLIGLLAFGMTGCGAVDTSSGSDAGSRGRLSDAAALHEAEDSADTHAGFSRHGRSSMTRERVRTSN